MTNEWEGLADWWLDGGYADPGYEEDVLPLLDRLLEGEVGTVADLGCGEGLVMRHLESRRDRLSLVGCDLSEKLLRRAVHTAPVVRAVLPSLRWLRPGVLDGAFAVYVLELVGDEGEFFAEVARVVRPHGFLVVIMNHPVYTAPGAAPIMDQDGEVLWRWGDYFERGTSVEPVADQTVTFHHRSLADVANRAARARWSLELMEELPLGEALAASNPAYAGQDQVPRLLGLRWRRSGELKSDSPIAD